MSDLEASQRKTPPREPKDAKHFLLTYFLILFSARKGLEFVAINLLLTTISHLPQLRQQGWALARYQKNPKLQEDYHYSRYKSKPDIKGWLYFSKRKKSCNIILGVSLPLFPQFSRLTVTVDPVW